LLVLLAHALRVLLALALRVLLAHALRVLLAHALRALLAHALRALLAHALRQARCVRVPPMAAPSRAALHVQLVAALRLAAARWQAQRSARCKRNMSRYR
ncbi:MAG TPA: hypothetical protein VFN67_36185, partial [Polyangiales bacterium]|nr:hypothetical protein [Polyangiales bacterium]